jgi:hypothetical protein
MFAGKSAHRDIPAIIITLSVKTAARVEGSFLFTFRKLL